MNLDVAPGLGDGILHNAKVATRLPVQTIAEPIGLTIENKAGKPIRKGLMIVSSGSGVRLMKFMPGFPVGQGPASLR